MAVGDQHRHDRCDLPDDLRFTAFAESRLHGDPSEARRTDPDERGIHKLIRAEQLTEDEVEGLPCDSPPESGMTRNGADTVI